METFIRNDLLSEWRRGDLGRWELVGTENTLHMSDKERRALSDLVTLVLIKQHFFFFLFSGRQLSKHPRKARVYQTFMIAIFSQSPELWWNKSRRIFPFPNNGLERTLGAVLNEFLLFRITAQSPRGPSLAHKHRIWTLKQLSLVKHHTESLCDAFISHS